MDFEPFLKRCESKFPKEECLDVIIKKMEDVFEDDNFSQNSKACELFYITNKVSKAQFFRMKKYVKELYEWLYEQGVVTEDQKNYVAKLTIDDIISDDEIRTCYFSGLNEAIDFIKAVGRQCGLGNDDDLLTIKSIVILSWHGVTRQQMCSIKKTDLSILDKTVQIQGKGKVHISEPYFNILYLFSEINTCKGFPSGREQTFEYSQYLMRGSKSERFDENKISQAIRRFNSVATDQLGRKISAIALQNNGIFCETMQRIDDGDNRSIYSIMQEVIGCDKHAAHWYKIMYERWRNIYYPEGSSR